MLPRLHPVVYSGMSGLNLSAHSAAQRGSLASVTEGDEGVSPNGPGFLLSPQAIHEVRSVCI